VFLEEKISSFGGDSIRRFEKKNHKKRYLTLNVYRNRPLESTNIKAFLTL